MLVALFHHIDIMNNLCTRTTVLWTLWYFTRRNVDWVTYTVLTAIGRCWTVADPVTVTNAITATSRAVTPFRPMTPAAIH